MKKIRVLLLKKHDENEEFVKSLQVFFSKRNIELNIVERFDKYGTINTLKQDKAFTAVIIQEHLNDSSPIDLRFIKEIKQEISNVRLIFIISDHHKDNIKYLQKLYDSKIYNTVFQQDISGEMIGKLILNYTKPEVSKSYLGLDEKKLHNTSEHESMESVDYKDMSSIIEYLYSSKDYKDLSSRYNLISKNYDESKNINIIARLPKELKNKLHGNKRYEIFRNKLEKAEENHIDIKSDKLEENKTRIITKQRIIKKEVIKHVYNLPKDYKKVISVFGFESVGKTTIASNLAYLLSENKVRTTLIDTDTEKKDVYYHFDKEYVDCLSKLNTSKECMDLGQVLNEYLTVFSEHKDRNVELSQEKLMNLINSSKKSSDIVIIDLSDKLKQETISTLLNFSDNILFISSQNMNSLYRTLDYISNYKDELDSIELVINRFVQGVKYLDSKSIRKHFFNSFKENPQQINVNNVFQIADDRKSIINGLALRKPAISISNNNIREDIKQIAEYYYKRTDNQKGFFKKLIKFVK
ncbi:hypothetical protein [Sporosalibacterium faouarense]|uniref:nucleotide-binding protein n=1 Tax=Sporosalibacterium faouarense TaxID=516123 RepID=UPI00192B9BFD